MEIDEETLYVLALSKIEKIGPIKGKNLVAYLGSAKEVFSSSKSNLEKIPKIGPLLAKKIKDKTTLCNAEKEIIQAEKMGISMLNFYHKNYPNRIKQINSSPLILYKKGQFELQPKISISIVGTRKPSAYGKNQVENFIDEISPYRPQIVSGLAYGIDIHAHWMALKYDLPTVAVLAHDLDTIYPSAHSKTATEMLKNNGGLISEFALQSKVDRENFPKRNRLIAGYCDALFVAETAKKGGSMITANLAFDYDRAVFALPGKITDKNSHGCHQLINQNKAFLYEDMQHFVEEMQFEDRSKSTVKKEPKNKLQKEILDLFDQNPKWSLNEIVVKLDKKPNEISAEILKMEIDNLLNSAPGNKYNLA